jgi:hypothetical protein
VPAIARSTRALTESGARGTTIARTAGVALGRLSLTGAEARALARHFAALAKIAAEDEPLPAVTEELTTRGLGRLAHFKCVQCHPTAAQPPEGVDPENLSINLTLAKTRLRPSWIRNFLAQPKTFVGTQTRMPTVFYDSDGTPKVDQPDRDIEAITAYLLHLTEPPELALARLDGERKQREQQPPTDWSRVDY